MFGFRAKEPASVRRLGAEHSEGAAGVHAASFTYAWPAADIEALLAARSTYADGAFLRGDELAGFVLSRVAADEAEILTVAVLPKRRGEGIAGQLMRANMAQLQQAGARSWFLEVEAQNASALALYRRFGFVQVGERRSYYRKADGDPASALILRRSLL